MNNNTGTKPKGDPAVLPAIALLLATLGFLAHASGFRFQPWIDWLSWFCEANAQLMIVGFGALIINVWTAFSLFLRVFGLKKQGARLRVIHREGKKTDKGNVMGAMIGVGVGLGVYLTTWVMLPFPVGWHFGGEGLRVFLVAYAASLGFAACFVTKSVSDIGRKFPWRWFLLSQLPKVPVTEQGIVVGSTGTEDRPLEESDWVTMNRRALNGNVLVTGSIGSGKTQGIVLPVFDQLLANFKPRPAILAIDPKGTFVREALEICKKRGILEQCVHLRLGGTETFNPVFVEGALKKSRFLDVAQMLRAAAVNFMGASGDSQFWEVSSFNLIKNTVVYCAATKDYYTLNDLYDAMVKTSNDDFLENLDSAVAAGKFDAEELFNINRAVHYFEKEFGQLDSKVRTGILATATSFLNQFQEFQASQLFCPPKSALTIKSMAELVDAGKIILFDVGSPALARSMGTFVKLLFEQSLLDRLIDGRPKDRCGVLLIDEYQDVVTTGDGASLGDERFLAKGREANTITIAATQSLTSIDNSVRREKAARELFQNFRTRIACHSSDVATIKLFQELAGDVDRERVSRGLAELAQDTKRNLFMGGFDAEHANITESVNISNERQPLIPGREFSRLKSFEAFAQIYDGQATDFKRIFLKPYFLQNKRMAHGKILKRMGAPATALAAAIFALALPCSGAPNVCDVVNSPAFQSCIEFSQGGCTCGWPSHPCASFSYYVPDTFVEVHPNPGETFFSGLPGVDAQIARIAAQRVPFGTEADLDTQSFQAHTISVPWADAAFAAMPCRSGIQNPLCFGAMSEHVAAHWASGSGDLRQPQFLAWAASPKACLLVGAARSLTGGGEAVFSPGSPVCSTSQAGLTTFPPSAHSTCNGWGVFFPRSGTYSGPSQTAGAAMIAARMKNLSSEVFHSAASSPDEKWQMIYPQASMCFREGENLSFLEVGKGVVEIGRLYKPRPKGHLFVTWRKVSCCTEMANIPIARAAIAGMTAACRGQGGLL